LPLTKEETAVINKDNAHNNILKHLKQDKESKLINTVKDQPVLHLNLKANPDHPRLRLTAAHPPTNPNHLTALALITDPLQQVNPAQTV
jgi:hypothetical protein